MKENESQLAGKNFVGKMSQWADRLDCIDICL